MQMHPAVLLVIAALPQHAPCRLPPHQQLQLRLQQHRQSAAAATAKAATAKAAQDTDSSSRA